MCIVIKKYTLLFWQLFNWCYFENEVSSKHLVITIEELQWMQTKNENEQYIYIYIYIYKHLHLN